MKTKQFVFALWLAAAVSGLAVLSACAAAVQPEPEEDDLQPAEEAAPDEPPDPTLVPRSGVVDLQNLTPVPGDGENIVQPAPGVPDPAARAALLAVQDLAESEGRDPSEIEVVLVEAVDWPDSSLGCPQPGMLYMQVITPGYRIVLELGPERYTYHTDRGTRAVQCEIESRDG